MKERNYRHPSWNRLATANEFGGMPPGGHDRSGMGSASRQPSLTEKFNKAAKKELKNVWSSPASKQKLEEMKLKMSQTRATFEMNSIGSIRNAYNPCGS